MTGCYLNPCGLHIVAILMLWKFPGLITKAEDGFDKEIGTKTVREKTVYDVTQVIRTDENSQTKILPEDLYVQEVNTSAYYYFLVTDDAYRRKCSYDKAVIWPCDFYGIKGFSIIFNEKASKVDVLAMKDMPIETNTTVNLLKRKDSIIDSITILLNDYRYCRTITEINDFLVYTMKIGSINQSKMIGLEYDDKFLERCADEWFSPFPSLNHTILKINVSPMRTLLSYGAFFENVHGLIRQNRRLVGKLNPKCTLYVRLENGNRTKTGSKEMYDVYSALMTTYLRTFSKQNTGNEIFIFSPTLKRVQIVPNSKFFRQRATIFYSIRGTASQYIGRWHCARQQLVNSMLSNVQNILLHDPHPEVLSSLFATCKMLTESAQNQFNLPLNSSLSLILTDLSPWGEIETQVEKIIEILRNNPNGIKISKGCIDTDRLETTGNLTKVMSLLQSQNIEVCCSNYYAELWTTNISAVVSHVIKHCGTLLNLSKEIIQPFKAEIRNAEDLFTFLVGVHEAKQYFEDLYPGKTLTPSVSLPTRGKYYSEGKESSYCDPDEKLAKEYYHAVYSFANIHGWSIMFPERKEFGIWSLVETFGQIDPLELSFFVPFRSNAPLIGTDKLPMTYPCIQKTQNANQSRINFTLNRYSGTTFQVNLREKSPVSTKELQTLLELAITRFPAVELIVARPEDFKLVESLTVSMNNAPSNDQLSTPWVYAEVPLEVANGLRQEVYTTLSNNRTAIHVSNWESMPYEQLNLLEGFQYSSTAPIFGVTVQYCSHGLNSTVATLRNLPFMPQVKYVVCNVEPDTPTNSKSWLIEKYLGTLFYTKSYMEHFLSTGRESRNKVEVMFRLNYSCSKGNEMENFLRFLNDVNQHSAAYKIRYFLVRAFETESSSVNCSNSWWRLDSYADLTNISTFVRREDEYAGREARIPFQPATLLVPAENSNVVYIVIFVPIVVLLILAVLALLLYQKILKSQILTEREIREFYNGVEQCTFTVISGYLDFGNMKYPKRCEIPLKDIQTEEIVGIGQFGVVHRGILCKRIEVAIKIPRSDCAKEEFKSMLSELKILCYIGEHSNIVSFLGACTKGIANGNLKIVVEYCKNGCLLRYLRESRADNETRPSISLYQMYGFSLQIASGMEYIAEKRVIHGDLAARNVLLTSESTCKIADFGLSRRLYEMDQYVKTSQEPLPWRWMAPESLRDREFTTKSDVWSYGVTVWEIFSLGMDPYPGLNWTVNYVTDLENGMRMGNAAYAADNIHAKILDCWNINSEARPTFKEMKEYFIGLRNEEYLKF